METKDTTPVQGLDSLRNKCNETYERIQQYRDVPDAFDLETDRMYLHDLIQDLQDDARKRGCVTKSIHDPAIDQALNAVAEIVSWCESQKPTNDCLPTPTTLKEWYTPSELAELMGKKPFTVREQWCNAGRIECEKDADTNKWRIPGKEVQRLVNGGCLKRKR